MDNLSNQDDQVGIAPRCVGISSGVFSFLESRILWVHENKTHGGGVVACDISIRDEHWFKVPATLRPTQRLVHVPGKAREDISGI